MKGDFNKFIKRVVKRLKFNKEKMNIKRKKLYIESSKPKEIVVEYAPKSFTAEEFRTLRTNLQFMSSNKNIKSVLVTSTTQEEGKSYVAANLAATFAQNGKKVVLVDADMRKGRQHGIFSIKVTPGLSNYLSGVCEEKIKLCGIDAFIQETCVENLSVMPMGNIPPNPSELIDSTMMEKLIEDLKKKFDLIIFDGTPSVLVTDAVILSRLADATIIVTGYNITKIDSLKKIEKDIKNVGGNIAGVVINQMPIKKSEYSNTYYYETYQEKE